MQVLIRELGFSFKKLGLKFLIFPSLSDKFRPDCSIASETSKSIFRKSKMLSGQLFPNKISLPYYHPRKGISFWVFKIIANFYLLLTTPILGQYLLIAHLEQIGEFVKQIFCPCRTNKSFKSCQYFFGITFISSSIDCYAFFVFIQPNLLLTIKTCTSTGI